MAVMRFELDIPFATIAKERARFSARSGTFYTPSATRNMTNAIALLAKVQMQGKPPLHTPLGMVIHYAMPLPDSIRESERAAMEGRFAKGKPDLTNLTKLIEDAFNGIVYTDDSLIVDQRHLKRYSANPHVRVRLWAVG